MMKNYRVLWFDDEFRTLDIINEKAMLADITLVGFSNAEEGLVELKKSHYKYDAVIVDGIFYLNSKTTNNNVTDKALAEVATQLAKLENQTKIPWFILSGQPGFTKNKNSFADFFKGNKVYDKLNNNDLVELWADLKTEADKKIETQIRHNYSDVFEVCSDLYIGESNHEKLLRLLLAIEHAETNNPTYFNEIRKIMEDVFSCCKAKGLFPADCTEMNARSSFLGKKEMLDYVPIYIQRSIHSVVQISQEGSHRLTIDNDVAEGIAPYLLKSTVLELLNILLWHKDFVDKHPEKIELNIQKNEMNPANETLHSDTITGVIEQDDDGNYHCGEHLLNYNYTKNNFQVGDRIQILETQINSSPKTNLYYLKFATKIVKTH